MITHMKEVNYFNTVRKEEIGNNNWAFHVLYLCEPWRVSGSSCNICTSSHILHICRNLRDKIINQCQMKNSVSCQSCECSPMHESVLFVGGGVPRTNIPSVWGLRFTLMLPPASCPPMTTQISAGLASPTFPLLVSETPGSFFIVTDGRLEFFDLGAKVGEGPSVVALPPSVCSFPGLAGGASCALMTPPPLSMWFCR